jgi:dTDP-4-dehydrorhamnose 3,5-epimerase
VPFEELPTQLDGPRLLAPRVFGDDRGFFVETYRRSELMALGIQEEMVQDNHSRSSRGVLRGLHFTVGRGAGKLVRCARGHVHDVLVDLRRGSPWFGQWEAFDLTEENGRMVYCPIGFAHGFCVVSEVADVYYNQSNYYSPPDDRAIKYDDPEIGIEWPLPADELVASQRDQNAPALADVAGELAFEYRR